MTMIKRVVSCFIMTKDLKVAVFLRRSTLPTFASHWAACSGSIEAGETPWQAAKRELYEETNLGEYIKGGVEPGAMHGLFVDAPMERRQNDSPESRAFPFLFRVYPFLVHLPDDWNLELRGTEHDIFKFVTLSELEQLYPTVPNLTQAFHHATFGQYLQAVPDSVRTWASNRRDGAMTMARQAIELLKVHPNADPKQMKMMRPSMVAITNVLNLYDEVGDADHVMKMIQEETTKAINLAVDSVVALLQKWHTERHASRGGHVDATSQNEEFRIATFSRSSTLATVLNKVHEACGSFVRLSVTCSKSFPGGEGELMAEELRLVYNEKACAADDDELIHSIQHYNLILIGCDCVMPNAIVNKVGSKRLVQAGREHNVPVYCCADGLKIWKDEFPPPLEAIFEIIPIGLVDNVVGAQNQSVFSHA
ncbi:hypothetical protein MPSEU_000631300 [Mayamaea pseudoterrestris]|nr:hypothetical protein MPSEU_000631300 [Mayamaea pseudoterrestris]